MMDDNLLLLSAFKEALCDAFPDLTKRDLTIKFRHLNAYNELKYLTIVTGGDTEIVSIYINSHHDYKVTIRRRASHGGPVFISENDPNVIDKLIKCTQEEIWHHSY